MSKDHIKGKKVLVENQDGLFEAVLSDEKKREILKLIDEKQIIVLINDDWNKKIKP